MQDVSTFRLYLLRAMYLLIAAGLAILIWPRMLDSPADAEHMRGVVWSLLTGMSLVALLGIRYPLRMLPLLMFELLWKATWLITIGLPLRQSGQLIGEFSETWFATMMGLVVSSLAIPWGYVVRTYLRAPGDRWTSRTSAASAVQGDVQKA